MTPMSSLMFPNLLNFIYIQFAVLLSVGKVNHEANGKPQPEIHPVFMRHTREKVKAGTEAYQRNQREIFNKGHHAKDEVYDNVNGNGDAEFTLLRIIPFE